MTRNRKASNDDLQRLVREAVEQAVKAALEEPIREMKAIVEDLKKELEDVKLINKQQGDEIATLKLAVNDLQQGKRIKYLRVFGIGVTEAEVKENGAEEAICKKVYDKLLVPVLQGALGKGYIREIPMLWNTLSCGYMSGKEHVDDSGRTIPPPGGQLQQQGDQGRCPQMQEGVSPYTFYGGEGGQNQEILVGGGPYQAHSPTVPEPSG
jgi:hypothetical protein